jgi:hypothetical protein
VASVLPSGGALVDKVIAHPITQPDLAVVLRVLESLSMDGSAPFREMTAFRTKCFQSFPVSHVQRMTLSQVLLLFADASSACLAQLRLVGLLLLVHAKHVSFRCQIDPEVDREGEMVALLARLFEVLERVG